MESRQISPNLALTMGTLAFATSFAGWSLLSPLATRIQHDLRLSEFEISLLIAVPVILGSLLRIPLGILTDRHGGRLIFSLLLTAMAPILLLISITETFPMFLFDALLLGLGGASFAVGVPFVARHFPPARQGFALGVYGAGNIGTAMAAWSAPRIAGAWGMPAVFITFALLQLVIAGVFWLLARDAPRPADALRPSIAQSLGLIRSERGVWVLSLFYFLTFGGFIAFSIYLPKMLIDLYAISPQEAGNRVFIFVVLATIGRPLGGWLADRWGGNQVLRGVFLAVTLMALALSMTTALIPLTIACLTASLCLGLGNGAVFKLVSQWFPGRTGAITGVVGAAGGLGGFFPPLVLGVVRQHLGSYTLGFILLVLVTLVCLMLNQHVLQIRTPVSTPQKA